MNRKLLNGLLLLTVATGGVATFTSCKDEDAVTNDLRVGQKNLGDQIEAIRKITDSDFRANLDKWLNDKVIAASNGEFQDLESVVYEVCLLEGYVDALEGRVQALEDADFQGQIDNIIDVLLAELTGRVDALEDWQGTAQSQIDQALAQALANAAAIENIQTKLTDIEARLTSFDIALGDMQKTIANLIAENAQILDRLSKAEADIEWLKNNLPEVEDFNGKIAVIYSFLNQKFAQFITDIPVHQTYNPVFGTINLPIGLQSNIIANYVYNSVHDVEFPDFNSTRNEYTTNPVIDDQTLTNLKSLGVEIETYYAQRNYFPAGDNNMGEIYLSVNPQNVNANGLKASLVKSNGEEILCNSDLHLYADDTELTFGYTRASGSPLYRMPVYITSDANDVNQIRFDFGDKGEVFRAFKSLVQNHQLTDFANVGRLIYEHLDGFLPAYGVKIAWQDSQIDPQGNVSYFENAVYSEYNMAVTTIHPLSFQTGVGESINKQLPLFDPISEYAERIINKIREEVNFEFENFGNFDYINIDFTPSDVTVNADNITIDLGGIPVTDADGNVIGYIEDGYTIVLEFDGAGSVDTENTRYVASNLVEEINKAIDQINEDNEELIADVESQVNDLIDQINAQIKDLEGSINDKLDNALNRIEQKLSGRLRYADKLVDLYNKIASRINTLLKDPNHYLQVMMAYKTSDAGLHHLSNNKAMPTTFRQAGGNVINLYATSYNAELIVPVFKKYLAISNVYRNGVPANFNLSAVNAAAGLNKVLEGRQQEVTIDVTNTQYFQPGYTYEVYYTALDYRGWTSTMKYYFTIK